MKRARLDAIRAAGRLGDTKLLKGLLKRFARCRRVPRVYCDAFRKAYEVERSITALEARLSRARKTASEFDTVLFELSQKASELERAANSLGISWLSARAIAAEAECARLSGYEDQWRRKLQDAAESCRIDCPYQASKYFASLGRDAEKRGELERAYVYFVQANAVLLRGLTKAERRYRRTDDLRRLCKRIRAESPNRCFDLERGAAGFVTFTDFSKTRLKSTPGEKELERVHAEYLPLLGYCLRKARANGQVERGQRFEVFWAITNEGRVDRVKITPSGESPGLESCIRKALRLFRYPRYPGERRTVTLPLEID